MAAPVVRQFAAFAAGANVQTIGSTVYFITGSQSDLWINRNRTNLYKEANSTQFKDARWFNGGGAFDTTGYIVGANTSWTPLTDGGGSDSYVSVWGFEVVEQSNITATNFIQMASYVTGTSYATVDAATAGLLLAGYYYGYDVSSGAGDFREVTLSYDTPS